MPDATLQERETPHTNEVATVVADELAPVIAQSVTPDQQTERERAQLDAQLEEKVRAHVDSLSGQEIERLANELPNSPSIPDSVKDDLRNVNRELHDNSQKLREIFFSAVTGTDKTGIQNLESLTPEERERAERNLRELLATCSDDQLVELYAKLGIKTGNPTETRQDIIDALMGSHLLERSLTDPTVVSQLSEVLANSGKLSPEISASIREVIEKAREAIEKAKEIIAKEIEARIQRLIERIARERGGTPIEQSEMGIGSDTRIVWPFYTEFLTALERVDEGKIFIPEARKEDEVVRGLNEVGEALRKEQEKDKKEDQDRRDIEADIRREIARIARLHPGLFNSLLGISLDQRSFLDPMTAAHMRPPYESAFD